MERTSKGKAHFAPGDAACRVVGCGGRPGAGRSGQATVEAAFLAPLLLVGLLLLLQPAIILYDRAVMEAAASSGCRLLETRSSQSDEEVRAFIERRLDAIPRVEVFHAGRWDVRFDGTQESEQVSVSISHVLKPLPLVGAALGIAGLADEGGMYRQEVACSASVRDEWLMNSEKGCDPKAWIERWNDKV